MTNFEPEGKPDVPEPWRIDEPVARPPASKSGDADAKTSGSEQSLDGLGRLDAFIAERDGGHTGRAKGNSSGPAQQSESPSSPPSAKRGKDREGLLAALKLAANEMSLASLKAQPGPVAVMRHDKDLFSLMTSSRTSKLGSAFGFASQHVANAVVTSVDNRDVVAVVLLVEQDQTSRKLLKLGVRDLTKADVVLRTAASDAALSEPSAPTRSTPAPPALPGVLTQDVRDRLAKHNQKILGMVKQGDQIAVPYFVALDFSVAGLLAGRLAEQVKPHRDRNSFTFTFKRIADKKWQELDKQSASSRCPAGKKHFKKLFGAMNATCVFSTK